MDEMSSMLNTLPGASADIDGFSFVLLPSGPWTSNITLSRILAEVQNMCTTWGRRTVVDRAHAIIFATCYPEQCGHRQYPEMQELGQRSTVCT